jgi:hypothetical protein
MIRSGQLKQMKLKEKIKIDFKDFFKFGKFDFIRLNQTKQWIIHHFPNPDGYEEIEEVYAGVIWQYGSIEFHFQNDELFLIYSDCIDTLDGGESLELKKWFLEDTAKLDLLSVMASLNQEKTDFVKTTHESTFSSVVLQLRSGVELVFFWRKSHKNPFRNMMNAVNQKTRIGLG